MSIENIKLTQTAYLKSIKSALSNRVKVATEADKLHSAGVISYADAFKQTQKLSTDVYASQAEIAKLAIKLEDMIKDVSSAVSEDGEKGSKEAESEEAESKEDQDLVSNMQELLKQLRTIATSEVSDFVATTKAKVPASRITAAKKAYEEAKKAHDEVKENADNLEAKKTDLDAAEKAYRGVSVSFDIMRLQEAYTEAVSKIGEGDKESLKRGLDADIKKAKQKYTSNIDKVFSYAQDALTEILKDEAVTPESSFYAFFKAVGEAIVRAYRAVVNFFTPKDIISEAHNANSCMEKIAIFSGMNQSDKNMVINAELRSSTNNALDTANVIQDNAGYIENSSSKLGRVAGRLAGKAADVVKAPFVAIKGCYNFVTGPLSTYTAPVDLYKHSADVLGNASSCAAPMVKIFKEQAEAELQKGKSQEQETVSSI
ncbi:hypothetical protein OAT84_00320 [Gammaproteobacteria bacterium]|nr:hypothetical protein [Gammaproteobacteria bacterium]